MMLGLKIRSGAGARDRSLGRAAFGCLGALLLNAGQGAGAAGGAQTTVDLVNPLVGTAPLDRQALIGNALPPGEPVYSGQTSPGARLPHSSVEAAPVNNNIALTYPNGVPVPDYYTNPTMIGFTGGGGSTYGGNAEPMIMPVVGTGQRHPLIAKRLMTRSARSLRPAIIRSSSTVSGRRWN
ncbi:hypothetical protein [Sphingobium sp. LB126]|uniref:hypothetical protein n=1 Tax=Sphingobium sp. LB126 TaxID=1983755 RepID=UPI001F5BCFA7|nr:hypothetical protein [Sphingobium sp. LB126]